MKTSKIRPNPLTRSRRRGHVTGAPALQWVEDAAGLCARATAIGRRCLLVENHRGILAFSSEQVRLRTGDGALCVTGRGLTLCEVRADSLMIRGEIDRVEMPCIEGGVPPVER